MNSNGSGDTGRLPFRIGVSFAETDPFPDEAPDVIFRRGLCGTQPASRRTDGSDHSAPFTGLARRKAAQASPLRTGQQTVDDLFFVLSQPASAGFTVAGAAPAPSRGRSSDLNSDGWAVIPQTIDPG